MPDDGRAMTKPPSVSPRAPPSVFRTAVFAVGTVLGISAHRLLAGGPVPWTQGAVASALPFAPGPAGARRPRAPVSVVAASVVAQAGPHGWLTPSTDGHGTHGAGVHVARHAPAYGSAAMTAAHALPAVLVAVLLHRADLTYRSPSRGPRATVGVVRARIATARALLRGRPAATPAASRPLAPTSVDQPPQKTVLADVVVPRGPPREGPAPVR